MRGRMILAIGVLVAATAPTWALAEDGVDLVNLAATKPNAFVKAVQSEMAALGYFKQAQDGILGRPTVRAINALCRDASLAARCLAGPLSPDGAQAVVSAINAAREAKGLAPLPTGGTNEEKPAASEETVAAAPEALPPPDALSAEVPVPGSEWTGSSGNGLTATVLEAGDQGAAFQIAGVSTEGGWVNVYAGDSIAAEPGSAWSFSVSGSFAGSSEGGALVRFAAFLPDGGYISEIADGVPIEGNGPFMISGVAPEGTATVQPYIQMWYPAGTRVENDRLQVTAASLSQ